MGDMYLIPMRWLLAHTGAGTDAGTLTSVTDDGCLQRINQASGASITVYHTFNDEVDVYRTHWWKCRSVASLQSSVIGSTVGPIHSPAP